MKSLVILESPHAGATPEDCDRNKRYLAACLRDSLMRGESPIASHGLYTLPGVLDDADPTERALGMEAGWEWLDHADRVVAYVDLGVSPGMQQGLNRAYSYVTIERRNLPGWGTL